MSRPLYTSPPALVVIGVLLLTVSSWTAIPLNPVPVTLQTAVILLIGILYGSWLGSLTVLIWLGLALLGLPLLSDGNGGLKPFYGATAGFIWAFPIATFLAGRLPAGRKFADVGKRLVGAVVLHALILAVGLIWLSLNIGPLTAFNKGVLPFLPGVVLKSVLVALLAGYTPLRHRKF